MNPFLLGLGRVSTWVLGRVSTWVLSGGYTGRLA